LGLPADIKENALAYLMVVLESADADRLDEDVAACATLLGELGAMDVFVLPSAAGAKLVEAREKAFWLAKASNADEIIDTVVPRASIPEFLGGVSELASDTGTLIAGCGHAGDGNVHLAIFQPDAGVREDVLHRVFALGMSLGGAISGEHGLGKQKAHHYIALEDPAKLALMRRIKAAFDPHAILNPGTIYD
jgi:glycolate oxidase